MKHINSASFNVDFDSTQVVKDELIVQFKNDSSGKVLIKNLKQSLYYLNKSQDENLKI